MDDPELDEPNVDEFDLEATGDAIIRRVQEHHDNFEEIIKTTPMLEAMSQASDATKTMRGDIMQFITLDKLNPDDPEGKIVIVDRIQQVIKYCNDRGNGQAPMHLKIMLIGLDKDDVISNSLAVLGGELDGQEMFNKLISGFGDLFKSLAEM